MPSHSHAIPGIFPIGLLVIIGGTAVLGLWIARRSQIGRTVGAMLGGALWAVPVVAMLIFVGRRTLPEFVGSCGAAGPAVRETQISTLTGTVTRHGLPVRGLPIVFRTSDGSSIASARTDRRGGFELEVRHDGALVEGVLQTEGVGDEHLQLHLKEGPGRVTTSGVKFDPGTYHVTIVTAMDEGLLAEFSVPTTALPSEDDEPLPGDLPELVRHWQADARHAPIIAGNPQPTAAEAEWDARNEALRQLAGAVGGDVRFEQWMASWDADFQWLDRAILRRHHETVPHSTGAYDFEMHRAYLQLDVKPELSEELTEMRRDWLGDRRLWALGGLGAAVLLTIGGLATYLRADCATGGRYRTRLKLATVAATTVAGSLIAALIPLG